MVLQQVLRAVDGGPFRWLCPAFRGTQVFFSQRLQEGSRRCLALLDSYSPGFFSPPKQGQAPGAGEEGEAPLGSGMT